MLAWDKSASLGEEAVLADSGRAGKVVAGVGRVRMLRAVKSNLGLPLNKGASGSSFGPYAYGRCRASLSVKPVAMFEHNSLRNASGVKVCQDAAMFFLNIVWRN